MVRQGREERQQGRVCAYREHLQVVADTIEEGPRERCHQHDQVKARLHARPAAGETAEITRSHAVDQRHQPFRLR